MLKTIENSYFTNLVTIPRAPLTNPSSAAVVLTKITYVEKLIGACVSQMCSIQHEKHSKASQQYLTSHFELEPLPGRAVGLDHAQVRLVTRVARLEHHCTPCNNSNSNSNSNS